MEHALGVKLAFDYRWTTHMPLALLALFGCQLAGDLLAEQFGIPIPGPVIGMMLMLAYLVVSGGVSESMQTIASPLLRHMSLLFIPAGSGILLYLELIKDEWLPIAVAITVSTLVTLLVSASVMRLGLSDRDTEQRGP